MNPHAERKATPMNAIRSPVQADVRVWVVAADAWRPATAFDEPTTFRALFPAIDRPLTLAEASAFVDGFNAEMLASGGCRWAVARRVAPREDEVDSTPISWHRDDIAVLDEGAAAESEAEFASR